MKAKLPVNCPSCQNAMVVAQLNCSVCETKVSGNYSLPILLQLADDEQQFVLHFFLSSGSLKEMASKLGISYPTVRNKLDDIISKINKFKNIN